MAEDPETTEGDNGEDEETAIERVIDELRDMPVGTNDPNIIGDAGPLDIPPGSDPHDPDELEE